MTIVLRVTRTSTEENEGNTPPFGSALFICVPLVLIGLWCRGKRRKWQQCIHGSVFDNELCNKTAGIHGDVDFVCTLKSDARDVEVTWFHDGSILSNSWGKHIIQADGRERRLTVRNISISDEGEYEIKVGNESNTAFLVVNKETWMVNLYSRPEHGFGIEILESDGGVYIADIKPNSPADRSTMLQKGDRILTLDQESMPAGRMQEMLNSRKHIELEVTLEEIKGKDNVCVFECEEDKI